jgi:UDP-2,4-diacetamido-2,4,6-trideoxy-beta-L-altropyranose hydrolase
MRIAVRADASAQIGTGHVMRCRTLAAELRRRGAEIVFVCREHEGNLIDVLRSDGYEVRALPRQASIPLHPSPSGYAAWLGATQEEDARETLAVIGDVNWMVVDDYALSTPWHRALRPRARRIMAIDDVADRPLDCDLLLDQNLSEVDGVLRYRHLIPEACAGMFGPRFALLSPAYAVRRQTLKPRNGSVKKALIAMGGSDMEDATGLAVDTMCSPALERIELDVVVGANYPHHERLSKRLAERGNALARGPLPDLVDAMADADIAIGAGGSTSWERLCLGLPTVVVSIAENQIDGCRALDRAGAAVYAGRLEELTSAALTVVLHEMLSDPARLRDMSERGLAMVDGRGTSRVADRLAERA